MGKNGQSIQAKHKLVVPADNTKGLPDYRPFVTMGEFCKYVKIKPETLKSNIKKGQIKAIKHPLNPQRYVIPIAEVRRILMADVGAPIPYRGRQYPHQFYIFFLLACLGASLKAVKEDLERYELLIPPDSELREMYESLFLTAPPIVRRKAKAKRDHTLSDDFDGWLAWLDYTDLYEDIYGYVPQAIMFDSRIRFMIEIMGAANFKPYEASDAIKRTSDLAIDPAVISNYIKLFHYIRPLSNEDWEGYVSDIARVDDHQAVLRNNCVDNKLSVYRYLSLDSDFVFADLYRDRMLKVMWAHDKLLESEEREDLTASVAQIRAMKIMSDLMQEDAVSSQYESKEIAYRRAMASGEAQGLNPANIPEASAEDTDPTFEELGQTEEKKDAQAG